MIKPIVTIILWVCISLTCFSQKQDYVWLFGVDEMSFPDETGYLFDFNNPPMQVQEHDNNIGIGSANASICDEEGNLLFYMNGCAVMNREFEMMPDGDSLGYDIWWEVFNKNCDRGIGGFQDHLVLSDPMNSDRYYVLHKPQLFNGFSEIDSVPIWYSTVDMNADGGLGDVIEKNMILDGSRIFLRSYLTAINHANGYDWWVVQAPIDDSVFYTYKLSIDGNNLTHIQPSGHLMTNNRTSSSGTAKFSPDGSKYAWYNYYDQLHIYDFDRLTGLFSNHQQIDVISDPDYYDLLFSSLEWSPSGRFIYTSSRDVLYQVDLWEDNIQEDGVRLIDIYNGTQDPFSTTFFLMAQAPDCKIYMCPTSGTRSYHVIHRPDELGTDCNFVQNGLRLPQSSNFGGMPNFPRFRVDEEDKCDPTLTSVFGDEVYYRRDLMVYPSPSDGRYTVEVPSDVTAGRLRVLTVDGQQVYETSITGPTLSIDIDITDMPVGQYHVELYPERSTDRVFYGSSVVKQ